MTQAVIEVEHLRRSFGDVRAVDDVSFTVSRGEIFGVIGPNGSGKTTTVECISGLQAADAGSVRVFGFDPIRQRANVRRIVGVQLQESRLADRITVMEALRLFAGFYSAPADPEELVDTFGLRDKAKAQFRTLSGGQKQRLSIALALVGNPRVIILDELTTGLDPSARRETWQAIARLRDRDVTVLLVTHFMDEAEYLCDRVAILQRGHIVALDAPSRIIAEGSATRVRISTTSTVDVAALDLLPGVVEVRREAGSIEIVGRTANLAFIVSGELARQGVKPDALDVRSSGLDDVMLNLPNPEDGGGPR